MRTQRKRATALAVSLVVGLAAATATAHSERDTPSPPRAGPVPDANRAPSQILTVCKLGSPGAPCAFEHIQAAVNAAPAGAKIRVHRGLYKEEPSRAAPDLPADQLDGKYSFAFHQQNPNAQNLITVLGGSTGKTNLTIEGWDERTNTLADPRDVVIDAGFVKHVAIRGDKADGFIVRNLSVYHAREHGIYILDQDGFITDRTIAGWNGDYGYLTFALDHGLQSNCEAFGSGDGGIYPGGSADLDLGDPDPVRSALPDAERWSVEVRNCKTYHNALGYSGTQGDWTYIHDNDFFDNALGLTDDSETDHPNYPQNRARLVNNRFWDNNFNVYASSSDITLTVFFGEIYLPVGTGVFFASGNANVADGNYFWDHSTVGHWQASGQGVVIGPTSDPPADPFMSSCNRATNNRMFPPPGALASQLQCDQGDCRNALDLSWDGLGNDNCWQGNQGLLPLGMPSQDFVPVACTDVPDPSQPCNVALGTGVPALNALQQVGLVYVCDPTITPGCDPEDPASCDPENCSVSERRPLCSFTMTQPCFKDPSQTQSNPNGRNRAGGMIPADDPLSALVATGGGRVLRSGGGSVTFSFDASRTAAGTAGSFRAKGVGLDAQGSIDALHRDAWVGTLDGPCTINGASGRCRITFLDRQFSDATTPAIGAAAAPPPDSRESFSLLATPNAGAPVEVPKTELRSGDVQLRRP